MTGIFTASTILESRLQVDSLVTSCLFALQNHRVRAEHLGQLGGFNRGDYRNYRHFCLVAPPEDIPREAGTGHYEIDLFLDGRLYQ